MKKMRFTEKGFTLIELLIVFAIIGILLSIIVSYLGQARPKGVDAGIKSDLQNARSQAEFYYNGAATSSRTYQGVCNDAISGIYRHLRAAGAKADNSPNLVYDNSLTTSFINASGVGNERCNDNGTEYAAWVPLRAAPNTAWCIDSRNNASRMVCSNMSGVATPYECPVACGS
jgi:prepilin-type N-terminal cleavage/methylation domain-containing protein